MTVRQLVMPLQSESGRSRLSALGELFCTPATTDKAARAAWRSANWRSRQRERLQDEQATRAGLISWRDLAQTPREHSLHAPGAHVSVDR